MTNVDSRHVIAYLAPEIPALSATFVYEELLGLERRGFSVIPVTVRKPTSPALDLPALTARTLCLYGKSKLALMVEGVTQLPLFGIRAVTALRWLAGDMVELGLFNPQSWKLVYQLFAAVRLARLLRGNGCIHLHVHFAHVPAQIAMYCSALTGIPFTITAHANDIFERGLLLPRKAERAKMLLTISENNRAYLESIGVPAGKLAVVRCGVSFETRLREGASVRNGVYRVGTLGRMVEKKGMDMLLRAISRLKMRSYRIELSLAGDGPMMEDLKSLASELELSDGLRFEGSLPHNKVKEWMCGLDVFVLACRQDANGDMDGIPVVLMEAMSQGVPVISTRLSGIPELVIHQQTGLLANPGDEADLSVQIDNLLSNATLRESLATKALAHVQGEFGRQINLDRLVGHMGLNMPLISNLVS